MIKRQRLALAILALVVSVAMIVFLPGSGYAKRQVVIVQAAETLLYLPLYIAYENGYFLDEGLKVQIVTGGGDSQAFAAILGGSAQVAQGDPMMVPLARQRGGPGKIVGSVVNRVAFWGVALDPAIPMIETPEDFEDLRVVTYPEPMTIYALQKRAVIKAGLTLGENAFIIQARFGTELAPLFANKADITMTIEPVVSQALARGARIVYSYPDRYGEYALTGIMVSDDLINDDPALVQSILNAYQRALTLAREDPEDAIAIAVHRFSDVDPSIISTATRRMIDELTLPSSTVITVTAYEKAIAVRLDIGDLEKPIPFDDAVDNRFAEEALKRFGPR